MAFLLDLGNGCQVPNIVEAMHDAGRYEADDDIAIFLERMTGTDLWDTGASSLLGTTRTRRPSASESRFTLLDHACQNVDLHHRTSSTTSARNSAPINIKIHHAALQDVGVSLQVDCFTLAADLGSECHPLASTAEYLVSLWALTDELALDPIRMHRFFVKVAQGYHHRPYHCELHALEVLVRAAAQAHLCATPLPPRRWERREASLVCLPVCVGALCSAVDAALGFDAEGLLDSPTGRGSLSHCATAAVGA